MATLSASLAPDTSTITTFKAWAQPISTFFSTCGWIQQNDTGQMVLTATVLTCTSVAVNGVSATYTYSSFTGPTPRIGMSFVFSTFGVGGNNVTATVTSLVAGVSVSVAQTTQATDTTGSGTTTVISNFGTGVMNYEIWKTGDSVGFDVYARVEYGVNSSVGGRASMAVTVGIGTNGAGTIVSPLTKLGPTQANNSVTTPMPCHLSGDASRMTMLMFQGNTAVTFGFNIERSYNNSGVAVGDYYCCSGFNPNSSASWVWQALFPTGGFTTQEAGMPVCVPKTATTGNVGSTTHVSPVLPLVGSLGNPQTGVLVYKGHDFSDNQLVFVTLYGVQQAYITQDVNATAVDGSAVACGFMMRFS